MKKNNKNINNNVYLYSARRIKFDGLWRLVECWKFK